MKIIISIFCTKLNYFNKKKSYLNYNIEENLYFKNLNNMPIYYNFFFQKKYITTGINFDLYIVSTINILENLSKITSCFLKTADNYILTNLFFNSFIKNSNCSIFNESNNNTNFFIPLIIDKKFIFFTYLEGFDNVTTSILINDNNYIEFDKKTLSTIDRSFRYNMTKWGFYFSPLEDLFEDEDFIPFKFNNKLENRVYIDYNILKKIDIGYTWATNDILTSFYYEPLFFFRDKIEQSLEDFWLISFFRERSFLLDERIFKNEEEALKKKIIFQPLADLAHKSELKASLKIFKRIYSYKEKQLFSNYLTLEDVQDYALDKNFVHIWNYWIGARHDLNIFGPYGWTGNINIYWEKFSTPQTHVLSRYYWSDYGYMAYNTRVLNFGFFPDLAMMWGHFNPYYDMYTTGYNRFFHFGDTFMDSTVSLKLLRYQLTINYWGDFEYLVQDFSSYQPAYFADPIATVWIPMILLVCKKYTSPSNMNVFIRDYNSVFQFKKYPQYSVVRGDVLFPLSNLERLELLRDITPVDQRLHCFEWVVNVYFGYNQSEFIINYPSWFSDFLDTTNFYFSTFYDYEEDKNLEEKSKDLVDSIFYKNYKYNSNISIYFNKPLPSLSLKIIFLYINEKLFDDAGHIITSISRNENFQKFNKFNWMANSSLIYFEVIPAPHFNWKLTILGFNVFDWNLIKHTKSFDVTFSLINSLIKGFSLDFRNLLTTDVYLCSGKFMFASKTTINPILALEFNFLPFLRVIKFLLFSDFFDNYFLQIFKTCNDFLDTIPNPFYFYYVSTILFNIEKIQYFLEKKYLIFSKNIDFLKEDYENVINDYNVKLISNYFYKVLNFLNFFFFYHQNSLIFTKFYIIADGKFKLGYFKKVNANYDKLPIEFFLIGSIYDNYAYIRTEIIFFNYSDFLPFFALTYFWNLQTYEDFQAFVLLWLTFQLNKDILNKTENIDYINAINRIDMWALKINNLEYERYKNYVLKHNLYKSN